ncbi:MAG: 4Fe-4S binding protein [Candidatus Lokiarchaeota archaeon]|nr:4Fe-4S binding protein [Candidatus Lokiarchaeota archaeon]
MDADAHEALRKRLEEFPIPAVAGKGILEFLRLAYSTEEAEMLSRFTSFQRFVTIDEFSRETGYPVAKVSDIFYRLAKRNMIRFNQRGGKDVFCIHPFVVGMFEAFFSASAKQDPVTLVPAAKAAQDYFDDAFHRAASGSKKPWARVMPALSPLVSHGDVDPERYDGMQSVQHTTGDLVAKGTSLLTYGAREIGKKVAEGKIGDVVEMVKADGPLIADAVMKGISSVFGLGPATVKTVAKAPAPRDPGTGRTIPIEGAVEARLAIYPYEVVLDCVKRASQILVTDCSCRKKNQLLKDAGDTSHPRDCKHPVEGTCMQFRYGSDRAHEYNAWGGREVSPDEAIGILDRCEKSGLVHMTFNSMEHIEFLCNCCPCCCGILGTMTRYHLLQPAFVGSNFTPVLEKPDACLRCHACITACPVHALHDGSTGTPELDGTSCIGCGACATRCAPRALVMKKVRNRRPAIDSVQAHVDFANNKS